MLQMPARPIADNLPSLAIDLQLVAPDASAEEIAHLANAIASRGLADLATIVAADALSVIALVPEKAPVLARLLAAIERVTRADIGPAVLSVVAPVDAARIGFAAALVDGGVLMITAFVEHVVLPALDVDGAGEVAVAALGSLLDAASGTLNDAQRHDARLVELCSRRSFDVAVRLAAQLARSTDSLDGQLLGRLAQSVAFQTSLFATLPASTALWLELVGSMAAPQQTAALDMFARLLHSSAGASPLQ